LGMLKFMNHAEIKKHLRAYLRTAYSDDRLAALLAHAQEGKLSYHSCCCFIGAATANHALRGHLGIGDRTEPHYQTARGAYGAELAEDAYCEIGWKLAYGRLDEDAARRRFLIPLVRAEMKRREQMGRTREMVIESARVRG
jgi:hypothetical protein